MIRIEHLRKEYEAGTPIEDLSVEIHEGDIIAVIGPSGTGKSTLLRLMNLMEEPTSGNIYLKGECITAQGFNKSLARRRIGMVFQAFSLFEHLNVIENIITAPVMLLGMSKQEAYDRGMELLDLVELSDRALSYPSELSGGQKQRVAIARAIAMEPEILLFDEPTSALDPKMVHEVVRIMRKLATMGTTMMIVTHEMEFAKDISNRVFYMDRGGIEEDSPTEDFFISPRSQLAKDFLSKERKLEREIMPLGFSLQQFQQELADFCIENRLPARLGYRLACVLEELVVNCIMPVVLQDAAIRISVTHSDSETVAFVSYGGEQNNPLPTEDVLEKKIILGLTDGCEYSYKTDNEIKLVFNSGIK